MCKNIIFYFALIFSLLSCKDKYELQKGIDYEFLKVSGDNQEGIFQHELENRTDIFISGLAVSENGKIYVGVNDSNGGTLFSSDDIGNTWVKITNFIEYKFHSGPYIIIPEDDFVYTTNFGYLFKVTQDGNKELIKEDVTTYCIGKYHILISSTYVNGLMYRGK